MKVKAFGLACAVLWVIAVAWATGLAIAGRGTVPFTFVNELYLSMLTPTYGGLVIGIVLGFIDAFIAGAIFAWLYNKFAK